MGRLCTALNGWTGKPGEGHGMSCGGREDIMTLPTGCTPDAIPGLVSRIVTPGWRA